MRREREYRAALVAAGVLFVATLLLPAPGQARRARRRTIPPPPAYLTLAREAVIGGDTDKAAGILERARRCWALHREACGFTAGAYRAVAGIVSLEQGRADDAATLLAQAVEEQPGNLTAWFYLGQALFRAGRPADAAAALERARPVGAELPGYWLLLARAHVESDAPAKARAALVDGLAQHPDDAALRRDAVLLFLEHDLLDGALRISRSFIQEGEAGEGADATAHILAAERLRAAGLPRRAAKVLEEAHLLRPGDPEILERLAWAYVESDMPFVASRLLERLTPEATSVRTTSARPAGAESAGSGTDGGDPLRTVRALAEQYRLADHPYDALRWTRRLPEVVERASGAAAIHLAMGAWDLAVAELLPHFRAGRLPVRDRYRLAHAALHTLRLDIVADIARALHDTSLAPMAARLRDAVRHCREHPTSCL